MNNINAEITSWAIWVYNSKNSILPPDNFMPNLYFNDPVLSSAQRYLMFIMQDSFFETVFKNDDDLKKLLPSNQDENYSFVSTRFGGTRINPQTFFSSLCASAFMQMFFFGIEDTETNFVILILKNFQDFKNAIRTNCIEMNVIHGISNIILSDETEIKVPWGIIKEVPKNIIKNIPFDYTKPVPNCLFIEKIKCPIFFDKSDQFDFTRYQNSINTNTLLMLPLSFAFASKDPNNPVIPIFTWSTTLMPFQTGFAISTFFQLPTRTPNINVSEIKTNVEKWAIKINEEYTTKIDVAIKRIVTSVTQRIDSADSLIDAVMVWENLVGTANEVSFRITASMAKLLEEELEKRKDVQKVLRKIYDIRSKVVHGSIKDEKEIKEASNKAIGYAIELLKKSFSRGKDWLEKSSECRSNEILLEFK
jgi:hypothetical protein